MPSVFSLPQKQQTWVLGRWRTGPMAGWSLRQHCSQILCRCWIMGIDCAAELITASGGKLAHAIPTFNGPDGVTQKNWCMMTMREGLGCAYGLHIFFPCRI